MATVCHWACGALLSLGHAGRGKTKQNNKNNEKKEYFGPRGSLTRAGGCSPSPPRMGRGREKCLCCGNPSPAFPMWSLHLPHSSPPMSIWFLLPSRLLENRPLQLPRGSQQDFNWGLKSTQPGCSAGTALANPAGTGRRSSAAHHVPGTPTYGAPLFYCPRKQAVLVQDSPQRWGLPPSLGAQLSPSPACPGCWEALSAHQAHCSPPPSWGVWSAGRFLLSPFCIPWGMRAAPSRHPNPSPAAPTSRGTEHITRLFYLVSCASLPSTAVVGGGFDRVPKLLPASRQAGLFATSKGGGICTITRLVMSSTQVCSITGPRAVGSQRATPPQQGTSWDAP